MKRKGKTKSKGKKAFMKTLVGGLTAIKKNMKAGLGSSKRRR